MLKDITAILIHYSDQAILHKALTSLKNLDSRLESVIVFQKRAMSLNGIHQSHWSDRIQYILIDDNDFGKALRNAVDTINSTYILFLHGVDYLSPAANVQLTYPKEVLVNSYYNRDIVIRYPLLVRTSLLKKHPLLSDFQLPFKDSLLPAWLSNIDTSLQLFGRDLIKQTRKNSSASTMEKQKFMQKYQFEKSRLKSPSLSVIIANYNMETYVENAVISCLLQSEQFQQILIMDDGSTDDSYKRLKRLSDGKRIKVFTKENGGKARALNELLLHVTSDFIVELDADDWLDPDAAAVIRRHVSKLPDDASVLYGNLRKWKQLNNDVLFKGIAKGTPIKKRADLLSYRFPLGPRVYRTSLLKKAGGFPVVAFENGRLYEDVSVLNQLVKNSRFRYDDFTVYNVREHQNSITKKNLTNWNDFLKTLK